MIEEFNKEALPHMRVLYNYAYKNAGNKADAEDLLQETYLRAYRFFDKYEKGTNCRAWLFRIMRNLYLNDCTKNNVERGMLDYSEIENFYENIKSDYTENTDFQEKIFSNLLDDDMTEAINSLQSEFKTVIILCDLEGFSYDEIANFTQCPIGTIRSRLHRARKVLRQKLSDYAKKKGFEVKREYSTA
jgi:RNA polymerase sigma-70 factor (ECF subfamily)